MNDNELHGLFSNLYGASDEAIHHFFAPGRVNLIGEHTDYNGGYVFPCALTFGTKLLLRKNGTKKLRFATMNFDHRAEVSLEEPFEKQGRSWYNYPMGVFNEFRKRGREVEGVDLLFSGDIPNGAGLSSSASLEMATAVAMNDLFSFGFSQVDLVKIGMDAENNFVGVNCGIMDQFIIAMGADDRAVMLNCDTLDYQHVPVVLKDVKIVIANTNKRRGLTDSKYNERRAECEKVVEILNQKKPIQNLSALNLSQFNALSGSIEDDTLKRRALHVISENDRTLNAVEALSKNDLATFGQLMNASHDSLRDNYEVTGDELDTLVEAAREMEGTIGSRMTGAGFGGCTVNLVKEDSVEQFLEEVGKRYEARTGLTPDFYIASIGGGARRIS